MLVARHRRNNSLSRVADWTIAFGILNAFRGALGRTAEVIAYHPGAVPGE